MAKKKTLILRGTELYSQHVHLPATLVPPNVPARPGTPPLVEMLIFSDNITEINGKTNLGPSQHTGFCFNVRGQDLWLCQAAFILPGIPKRHFKKGGQIQARGMLDFSSSANAIVAITGGTGDYRDASGEIELEVLSQNPTVTRFTVRIRIP
jgi:hypothetical protein